jgi:hypothetical protein
MKALKICILILSAGFLFSCNKSGSSTTPSSAMSANLGSGTVNLTASFTNSNGLIVMTGSSSSNTVQLYLKLSGGGGGTFTLGDPSTSYYATVGNSFASYSTSATYIGQAVVSQGSNGLYSGTFYFNAVETSPTAGGGTISVSSGSFSNM